MTTTVIETCRISPPVEAASELVVPLSFFDIQWLPFHPIRHLFYEHPCSESSFLEEVVPKLKQSLSDTLKHYLPVAGNLLYPSDVVARKPVLRYAPGDSVCLTLAKSSSDFAELIGNHARDADQFYDFVPPLPTPPPLPSDDYRMDPLIAVQVTLFPGRGVCLGLALRHCLGDASSILGFVSAWASVNKGDAGVELRPPGFDRSVIGDTYGIDAVFWEEMRQVPPETSAPSSPIPTNRVRATFALSECDIDRLKARLKPAAAAASSFVVTTSYVWSCLAKTGGEEEVESQLLVFSADARRLINPAVPADYFGNCLTAGVVILEHEKLAGDEGFAAAAREVGDAVRKLVNVDKDEFVKSFRDWASEKRGFEGIRAMATTAVTGSPKFDFGAADFGWGKLRSQEIVSMDEEKYSMFLSKSLMDDDEEGGLEVGLSLPREKNGSFCSCFCIWPEDMNAILIITST